MTKPTLKVDWTMFQSHINRMRIEQNMQGHLVGHPRELQLIKGAVEGRYEIPFEIIEIEHTRNIVQSGLDDDNLFSTKIVPVNKSATMFTLCFENDEEMVLFRLKYV